MPALHEQSAEGRSRGTGLELPILSSPPRGQDLLSRLLDDQQRLTAVEEFSRDHDRGGLPAQAKFYSRLLPATPPGPGQQYAFDVDLDRCSGCKACVTACHTLNGLDEEETWRDVGLLIGGTSAQPVLQHVTTACHHCLEPACMAGCPVDAYEKDPVTGIVRHLDDQCFGCQYCTLACPYDVPKYHAGKGIVRKCDLCSNRLAVGEAPACVQACPHEAISIQLVDTRQVREDAEANVFLPAAPEPHITLPTTTYRTRRVFPRNLLPADYHSTSPQHPHWPLIVMLVLTQLSVGAFWINLLLETVLTPAAAAELRPIQATSALAFGLLALSASLLHLGRPQYAFRAVIGLRHSWLSREIVAFGLFAGAAVLYAASSWLTGVPPAATRVLSWSVALFGLLGVFCSVMIYVFTRREFWSLNSTAARFGLSTLLLGGATTWAALLVAQRVSGGPQAAALVQDCGFWLSRGILVVGAAKLLFELSLLRHLADRRTTSLKRSAMLMLGPLSNVTLARFAAGVLGGVMMPLLLLSSQADAFARSSVLILVGMQFAACLVGELLERYLFFAAASAPRMPGGLRS
ncbi:MAG: dimethyl sulfoxide reductase anchor subunit [Planctomyces sp.]|nr:dimethyl sulfoxide reductase anchor subunit [Planctomyces sp.]